MKTNRPGGLSLTRAALELCKFKAHDRILDAGCGYGATCRFLAQEKDLRTVGLDASPDRIFMDQDTPDWMRIRSRLPRLPFKPLAFQGIFCECVLSLVKDKKTCLNEFFRVLKPGGKLVLTDLYLPGNNLEKRPGPIQTCLDGAVSPAALGQALGEAGFTIQKYEDHTRLLKEMACEMVFKHGSLDKFWQTLTHDLCNTGFTPQCRTGKLKPGYCMVIAEK